MGGEDEIVRIARRLDKMVAKKNAVSAGGRAPAVQLGWGPPRTWGPVWRTRPPPFPQHPLLAAALLDPTSASVRVVRGLPLPRSHFWGLSVSAPRSLHRTGADALPIQVGFSPPGPSPSPFRMLCGGVGSTHCHSLGGHPCVPPSQRPVLPAPCLLLHSILSPSPPSHWSPLEGESPPAWSSRLPSEKPRC